MRPYCGSGRTGGRHGGGRGGGRGGRGRGGRGVNGRGAPYHQPIPPSQAYGAPPPPLPNAYMTPPRQEFRYPSHQQHPVFIQHEQYPPQHHLPPYHHHPQHLQHPPPFEYAPDYHPPPPAYGHNRNQASGMLQGPPPPFTHYSPPHRSHHPPQHLPPPSQRSYTTNTQSFREADNARQRAYLPVAAVSKIQEDTEEKEEYFEDERPRSGSILSPPEVRPSVPRDQQHQPPQQQQQHSSYHPPPSQYYPPSSTPYSQPTTTIHRPPPPSYCCHKCHTPGHWIQQCPLNIHPPPSSRPFNPSLSGGENARPINPSLDPPVHVEMSQTNEGEEAFHCEPCDKSFSMESQYLAHTKTHVKCWAPECVFEGSKRVIGAHYQSTHGQFAGSGLKEIEVEGQKFMVLMGNSPTEIAAWRAERRKKWPKNEK